MYKLIFFKRWIIMMSLMMGVALTASADRIKIGDLYYTLDATDHTATVVNEIYNSEENYASLPAEVVIPEEVTSDGTEYAVTSISASAFYSCRGLKKVTIPSTIKSIGEGAFINCTGLTSLTIEDGNISLSLPKDIFQDCPLETLYLGRDLQYPYSSYSPSSPFLNKETLKDVTIGNEVTSIRAYSFYGCKELSEITIPNSVTTIGMSAFYGCTGLSNVTMSTSVTSIPQWAFGACEALNEITIPSSVSYIGQNAFLNCKGLVEINIPSSVDNIDYYAFENCTGLKTVTIEDGKNTLTVGEYIFKNAPVEKLYLGRNLKSKFNVGLEKFPFYENTTLRNVTIGPEVTSIYDYAFYGCTALIEVDMASSVTSIGECAFYDCKELTEITIPGSVTVIGRGAFANCTQLNTLTIADSEDTLLLLEEAFTNDCPLETLYLGRILETSYGYNNSCYHFSRFYQSLKYVTIGPKVTKIWSYAFERCTGLTKVTIPSPCSLTSIDSGAFEDCAALTEFTIPSSVTSIGIHAFWNCSGLTAITIPSSVTSIGENAFLNCTGMKSLRFDDGESTLAIGEAAFRGCPYETLYLGRNLTYTYTSDIISRTQSLKNVVIGHQVTSIGNNFFYMCSGLTEITIPSSVTYIGKNAFYGCDGLKYLTIEDGESQLSFGDYALDFPMEKLYLGRNLTYSESPFKLHSTLAEVEIGPKVTLLSNNIFYGCDGLTKITIPTSVTSIGNSAFYGCKGLTEITIPTSVTSIDNNAFNSCKGLTEITIPASVTSIGYYVFNDCSNLKNVYSHSFNIAGMNSTVFPDTATLTFIANQENVAQLSGSNLIEFFNNVRIEFDEKLYAWVTTPELISIANEHRVDSRNTLVPLGNETVAKVEKNSVHFVGLSGRDITKKISSAAGFHFTPYATYADNVFTVAASGIETSKCITLASAGTLFEKIGMNKIENVEYLKVTGDINGTDVLTINRMTSLITLDLSEANIVEGGVTYRDNYKTQNNVVGSYFINGIGLKYLKLPLSVTTIDESAFRNVNTLTGIEIGSSVTTIGSYAFNGCGLAEIKIPSSVYSIGPYALKECNSLKTMIIEDGTGYILLGADLLAKTPLEKLYLGRNIDFPSYYAPFSYKTTLNDAKIGTQVTAISDYTFNGCSGLTEIVIPSSVTSIGATAFSGCTGLTEIAIPSSVTYIGESAFYNCTGFTEMSIPSSVYEIGTAAFRDCKNLQSIKLPQTLREIHNYTFSGCSALKSIVIPEKVHTIGAYAFSGTAISEVQLPDSVASVGEGAFKGCANIRKVYSLNATPPAIASSTFDYTTQSNAPLYVRKGSLVYYWLDPEWKNFLEISDDLICLNAIPDARYGDGEIDLNEYNPDGLDLVYESSNIEVVQIEGSKMRIVGAGSATIGARTVGEGTSMELMNKMRQLNVLKADLTVGVADITINEGEALPEFTYTFSGLQYSDTPDDIEELPVAMCEVTPASPAGEYKVTYTPGRDRNYAISTLPAKVTVVNNSGIEDINADADTDGEIEVFNLNGVCVFQGPRSEANLTKGLYIIRQGNIVAKVLVR